MSITLVDSAVDKIFSGTDLTITHGMTILENDVLVFIGNSNATATISNLDGFTSSMSEGYATSKIDVAYKVAGASEASSYTFVYTASDRRSGTILQFRGVNTSTPFDVAPLLANIGEGTSTAATAPTITTNTDGAYAVCFVAADTGSTTNFTAYTNGFTEQTEAVNGNSHSSATKLITTAGAVGATSATLNASRQWGALQFAMLDAAASTGLTIDSTDASMQRNTDFQVVCSTPSTTPTTGNTTLSVGGDTLTPSSVTGSDPYTITFPVGDLSKQVDATGYDWTLTVDAETATTGNIPLAIQAGYTLVDLVDPVTTNTSLLFGAVGTPITTDHLEYTITSTLDSGVTLSDVAANGVWTVTEVTEGDWVTDITVSRRVVQANGTIGTEAVVTLSAATGLTTLVGSLVQDAVSGIISNMVN